MIKQNVLPNFVGNEETKTIFQETISKCIKDKREFPHTLIIGSSGMGKNKLAEFISREIGANVLELDCSNRNINLVNNLLKLPDKSILLLDNIHLLPIEIIHNVLFRFMDEGKIYLRYPDGRIEPFDVGKRITILGTTSEFEKVLPPFIKRFNLILEIDSYTHDNICQIIRDFLAPISLSEDAISILANTTRYNPRIAIQNAMLVKKYAQQNTATKLESQDIDKILLSNKINTYYAHIITDYIKNNNFLQNEKDKRLCHYESLIIQLQLNGFIDCEQFLNLLQNEYSQSDSICHRLR
ncbi:AAA family ATPase [Methanospirillum sp. J.3.6.1-F.2.7.3]|uniref:AAA family ATPase n=1 Tax=Methanospirillum purgamenti TaxID=2834276 RepID=A0A8E7EKF8_9EURY|nr:MULTISPECIES: AAA family ATPase [Methanospirillum]MDX8551930.1 AAA family ATPase [Methanospirillum hungatei]QVV89656.1 AAA family ATPase [Methanospirillum sp. J.3.6.1-F.2.7.3]